MIQAWCEEKGGRVLRTARPMPLDVWTVRDVAKKVRKVPNFLGRKNPYDVFLNPLNHTLLVDDVGLIFIKSVSDGVEAHITFWDRRLRGREAICRKVAEKVLCISPCIKTAIPSDSKAVRAFAERVGFKSVFEKNGSVFYIMRSNDGT